MTAPPPDPTKAQQALLKQVAQALANHTNKGLTLELSALAVFKMAATLLTACYTPLAGADRKYALNYIKAAIHSLDELDPAFKRCLVMIEQDFLKKGITIGLEFAEEKELKKKLEQAESEFDNVFVSKVTVPTDDNVN